jgi:hypothetical protein
MALMLEHEWTAWYDHARPGRTANDYEKTLHKYCVFNTIQTFWGTFYNMSALQTLPVKSGYHIMKSDAKPVWEDSKNRTGGIWQIRIRKDDGPLVWKELLMALVSD